MNEDFVQLQMRTTIPAGQSSGNISIQIIDDNIYEGKEQFNVNLLMNDSVSFLKLGDISAAEITIEDNDSKLQNLGTVEL